MFLIRFWNEILSPQSKITSSFQLGVCTLVKQKELIYIICVLEAPVVLCVSLCHNFSVFAGNIDRDYVNQYVHYKKEFLRFGTISRNSF